MFNVIMMYIVIGMLTGMSIELLMLETDLNKDTTIFERFLWIMFWPIFVLIFLFGMKK